jgi:hypothetical protein
MNQNAEEEQMQCGGRNGMLRAARGRCDWFAYGVYVCFSPYAKIGVSLKQDSSRLLLFVMFFRRG